MTWVQLILIFIFSSFSLFAEKTVAPMTAREAEDIATEAYIYGYPLVTMEMTRRVMTNVSSPEESKAPMGQFAHSRTFPNVAFRDFIAPNADMLYSTAWLDLSKEPYVLQVPDENGRYYLMPMLSGWTTVFADPGTRTTGTKEANYLVAGPNWQGTVPPKMTLFRSPTNLVWILGRTYSDGTPQDYSIVYEIQNQYTLTPLSAWGQKYIPPQTPVELLIDMRTPVRDQVHQMDAQTFFNVLAAALVNNPPFPEDAPILTKMAKIGILHGKRFDLFALDAMSQRGVNRAPAEALDTIMKHQYLAGSTVNNWQFLTQTGLYGTDYLQRAYISMFELGANLAQDTVQATAVVDEEGRPLRGTKNYRIHFPPNGTPPAKGLWSITLYNDAYSFVNNRINRYSISPRDQLKLNPDGSLDIYIQNSSPGGAKESNWLPTPIDSFVLMLRLYWPDVAFLNGSWKPPPVQAVE